MSARNEIDEIFRRLEKVEAAIVDIRKALDIDRDQTIKALKEVDEYLFPVVYKLFPKVLADHLKIIDIFDGKSPPPPAEDSSSGN